MAKRVNSKFLIILTVVVLGGGVAALLASRFIHSKVGDPKRLVAEAEKLDEQGEYEKSSELYRAASAADPTNTEIMLKLGDALAHLTPVDPDYLRAAHNVWNKAVQQDPRYTPALNRLLDSFWDILEVQPKPDPSLFADCRKIAERLLAVEPGNKRAAARKHITVIRQWLTTKSGSVQNVAEAVKGLEDLRRKDPANADLPYWIAQARVREAEGMIGSGQTSRAEALLERAGGDVRRALEGAAGQRGPALPGVDPVPVAGADRPADQGRDRQGQGRPVRQADRRGDRGARKSTDKDPHYVDTQLAVARWYERQGKPEEAKKIITAYYQGHKDDQNARLPMARMLGRDKETRAEAIRILSQPIPEDKTVFGFKAVLRHELEGQTAHELVKMRLAEYATTADAAKRKDLERQVEAGIEKYRKLSNNPRDYHVPELEGRLHLLKGEQVEAVKSLEEATRRLQTQGGTDYDLMLLLGRTYMVTKQPGQARAKLEKVISDLPTWADPRTSLIELLMQDGDVEGARRHFNVLRGQYPDNPDVKRLEGTLAVLDTHNPASGSAEKFKEMPEKTREERDRKVQLAMLIDKPDEAIKLLRMNVKEDPKDPSSWRTMAAIYESRGQKDRAMDTAEEALKAIPDDLSLKMTSLRLGNAKAANVYPQLKPLVEKTADEFTREIQLFELERGRRAPRRRPPALTEGAPSCTPTTSACLTRCTATTSHGGTGPRPKSTSTSWSP